MTWVNLVVGTYSVQTLDIANWSINQRISVLTECLTKLEQYRTERMQKDEEWRWQDYSGRASMIFVAPEYMFTAKNFQLCFISDLKSNRFLEKDERDNVVAALQKISSRYGSQLVFAPGSIAFRQKLSSIAIDRLEKVSLAKTHIETAATHLQKRQYPSLTGDAYLDKTLASDLAGHAPQTPREKLQQLHKAGTDTTGTYYLADNAMYLFNRGRIIASYTKRADFHERLPDAPANTIFIPGIKPGRATVGAINFGIEICFDHANGVLKSTPSGTGVLPSVHLLCSASVGNDTSSVLVREGGYLIHASSDESETVIRRKMSGAWQDAMEKQSPIAKGGKLKLGTIELNI